MGKRGQITVFIIIGIIIITILGLFIYTQSYSLKNLFQKETTESKLLSDETSIIQTQINDCLKDRLQESVLLMGLGGGYINLSEDTLNINNSRISYLYNKGKITLPAIKEIEKQLGLYLILTMPDCINDSEYKELTLTKGEIKPVISINKKDISASVDYPITISKGTVTKTITEKYSGRIPIRFGEVHSAVYNLLKNYNPEQTDLEYLSSFNYIINIIAYSEDTHVYMIRDNSFKVNEVPFTFIFAIRLK